MFALTTEAKGLETRTTNVEAFVRSWDGEISRLRSTLVVAEKEKEEAAVEKERIQ